MKKNKQVQLLKKVLYTPEEMQKLKGKKNTKISLYGKRLIEKQRIRAFYGNISEKQFQKLYQKAKLMSGDILLNFLRLLELRLDTIVFRMNFAQSFNEARQLISHGHILVNNKKVTISSVDVKPGDTIGLHPHYLKKWKAKLITQVNELNLANLPNPSILRQQLTNYTSQEKKKQNYQLALKFGHNLNVLKHIEKYKSLNKKWKYYPLLFNYHPNYIEVNYNLLKGIVLYNPPLAEIYFPLFFNFELLKQFYYKL